MDQVKVGHVETERMERKRNKSANSVASFKGPILYRFLDLFPAKSHTMLDLPHVSGIKRGKNKATARRGPKQVAGRCR